MQTYRLTFKLGGARWTEIHGAQSKFVAIQIARSMLELLVGELAPKSALVSVNTHSDGRLCGEWDYACDRPQRLVWEPVAPEGPAIRTGPESQPAPSAKSAA